jgi:hypothetical protein
MSLCPTQPLPEPYPEDVRRARWAPFWETLREAHQERLDLNRLLHFKQPDIPQSNPYSEIPKINAGFPDFLGNTRVLWVVLDAMTQSRMPSGLREALRLGARLDLQSSLLFAKGLPKDDFVDLVSWGFDPLAPDTDGQTAVEHHLDNPAIIKVALSMGVDPFVPLPFGLSLDERLARIEKSAWAAVHPEGYPEVRALFDILKQQRALEAALPGAAGVAGPGMPRL